GAQHPVLVDGAVHALDQVGVDHRVVGVAVVAHDLGLGLLRGVVEGVDGLRVEDPVGDLAVVGGAVAVAGAPRVHLGAGEAAVQVVGDLGGALPGADDGERAGGGALAQRLQAVQQVLVVPDALAEPDAFGQARGQPGGDDEVAGPGAVGALPAG